MYQWRGPSTTASRSRPSPPPQSYSPPGTGAPTACRTGEREGEREGRDDCKASTPPPLRVLGQNITNRSPTPPPLSSLHAQTCTGLSRSATPPPPLTPQDPVGATFEPLRKRPKCEGGVVDTDFLALQQQLHCTREHFMTPIASALLLGLHGSSAQGGVYEGSGVGFSDRPLVTTSSIIESRQQRPHLCRSAFSYMKAGLLTDAGEGEQEEEEGDLEDVYPISDLQSTAPAGGTIVTTSSSEAGNWSGFVCTESMQLFARSCIDTVDSWLTPEF